MPKAITQLLLVPGLLLLAGCLAASTDTGSARFAVSLRQGLSTNITRISVTSSAADMSSVSVELTPTNGVWGGTIGNIPVGSNRSFVAQAFDASGTLLFKGAASGVVIYADHTTLVAISLQEVNAPPPFQNEAPVIDALVASSTSVLAGGALSLQATVHDPNTGDRLSYAWSSSAGSFSSATTPVTSWTAPASTGIQTLTFTVTDSAGLSSTISLAVNVTQAEGQGEAQVSISFNTSPRVASLSAAPTQLAVGQASAVSVSASDPDGDTLSYAWSATCAGSWSNASSSSARFTPSEVPTGACNNCHLTVSVVDGRGGQSTGTVGVCVGNAPGPNHFNPVITRSYRSSDTAGAAQVLTYEVEASDPEGSVLTFAWAANTGTLGTAAHGASSSRITWTAPSCVSASSAPTITATVTNAFNLTATKSFAVTGLPACSGWVSTGSMALPRQGHTAAPLANGKVLVAGGFSNAGYLATAEVYDSASGTWSPANVMSSPRMDHTATLLPNGKVLVVGGRDSGSYFATAEVYDPASGTWSATGSMASRRTYHTATVLPNGKVLVTGGYISMFLATAEVYDPASGTWSGAASMASPRYDHKATLLPDGKVLVSGGYGNSGHLTSVEVYDPASNTWSTTGSMASPRHGHTATLLPNGKVLVTGGNGTTGYVATTEVYAPSSGTWSAAIGMSSTRYTHTATLLPNGKVLVAGGYVASGHSVRTEVYDPASGSWSSAGSMASPHAAHTATLLPNGKVLVAGGEGNNGYALAAAELHTP
jgi:N-acetylneuraminic acid mutarotase